MDYLTAWREGHKAGMELSLQIINELTGHDFETASEVVLLIKELEHERDINYLGGNQEKMMDSMAQKIAIQNYLWKD